MRRIEARRRGQRAERRRNGAGKGNSNTAADQSQKRAFKKELRHDTAIGRAQGLHQSNFLRALADRDQHDVDNADCAQRQRDQPHASQKSVHGIEDLADSLLAFDGVPAFKGLLIMDIEAVVAGDDPAGLLDGCRVLRAAHRLAVDERNVVGAVGGLNREKQPHRSKRHIDAEVGGVVFIPPHAGQHPHDLKADSVQQNCAAHRRTARKKIALHLVANHRHRPALLVVPVVQPPPLADRQITYLIEVGRDSNHLPVAGGEIAHRPNVPPLQYRRSRPHQSGLFADILIVLICKEIRLHPLMLRLHGRNAPGEDKHDVLAHGFKLPPVPRPKPLAQPDQHQQRNHPIGDTEHGQE